MTKTAETLKIELAQLPAQDRAELAYFLIHSFDTFISVDAQQFEIATTPELLDLFPLSSFL